MRVSAKVALLAVAAVAYATATTAFSSRVSALVRPRVIHGAPAPEQTTTLAVQNRMGAQAQLCTGVLIAKGRVLTAAHCVCETDCDVTLIFGMSLSSNDRIRADNVLLHPDYDRHRLFMPQPGHDLAIVAFDAASAPGNLQTASILSAATLQRTGPSQLTVVGYGLTEAGNSGEKRKATVPIASLACIQQWAISLGCETWRELILSTEIAAVSGTWRPRDTCNGDSGGPAFRNIGNDSAVAAITSRGLLLSGLSDTCGTGGIYEIPGTVPNIKWISAQVPDVHIQ